MLVCLLSFTFLYVFITCIAAFVRNKLMMMMIGLYSVSGFGIDDWWSVIDSVNRGVIYSTKHGRPFIAQTATHQ